ncbi:MAG: nitroreductase family deazaflavin-dependent oxidoreductase [Cryobacterium sp.]|nr:nitroreductase family deazaflavin-dependent oxidoreductase [Cryobacterium sp.]
MTNEPGSTPENPLDTDVAWVAAQINGFDNHAAGQEWPTQGGAPLLLITTKGAKTGIWRRTALIYGESGGKYLIVASKGGAPSDPGWYANLVANPEVYLQVEDRKFKARAKTASDLEKPGYWSLMTKIWPQYDDYKSKTDRKIPLVVLEPIA